MNKKKCVYLITTDFNDKKYIGVAEDFDRRMYQHQYYHDANHSYIDNSIREHGWEHYKVIIIDHYSSLEERKQLEQKYIKLYHSHRSENGYNLTWGGDDACFPDMKGENNPRAQLTTDDVKSIRMRRMNGERLSDVYEDYKEKCPGGKRGGFSKVWLHESWLDICPEFKGKYPQVSTQHYKSITKNILDEKDQEYLIKYFKWHGPIPKYNIIFQNFKNKIDWESFQKLCGSIVTSLYGNPSNRKYHKKTGKLQKEIEQYKLELGEEPIYS